jgi:hypothetical protein
MKGLNLKQPYATAILAAEKLETRKWATSYRGPVLICASEKSYGYYDVINISGKQLSDKMYSLIGNDPTITLISHAIAIADLVEVRVMNHEDEEKSFVIYQPGIWVHVFKNVKRIIPFFWKGKLNYYHIDPTVENQIKYP